MQPFASVHTRCTRAPARTNTRRRLKRERRWATDERVCRNLSPRLVLPQHLGDVANGVADGSLPHGGPKVYGIVQRVGADRQQEVMAREWTASHLQDEMKYIREVSGSQTGGISSSIGSVCGGRLTKMLPVLPSPAGEGFLGEGERAHVWAVRRDAAIHAEAHAGDQGTEGLRATEEKNKSIETTTPMPSVHALRQPTHTGGVWSQR